MVKRICALVCVIGIVALDAFSSEAATQRRAAGQATAGQGVQVSLKIGAETYETRGPGKCTHAPTASIYQVVSELWSVQQSGDGRSLSMSYWKPKDGSGDMVTLSVSGGGTAHEVNTGRGGGAISGSGTVTLQKSGNGGTFTVDAKTKEGKDLTGTIQCDAFAPHLAEGG